MDNNYYDYSSKQFFRNLRRCQKLETCSASLMSSTNSGVFLHNPSRPYRGRLHAISRHWPRQDHLRVGHGFPDAKILQFATKLNDHVLLLFGQCVKNLL